MQVHMHLVLFFQESQKACSIWELALHNSSTSRNSSWASPLWLHDCQLWTSYEFCTNLHSPYACPGLPSNSSWFWQIRFPFPSIISASVLKVQSEERSRSESAPSQRFLRVKCSRSVLYMLFVFIYYNAYILKNVHNAKVIAEIWKHRFECYL